MWQHGEPSSVSLLPSSCTTWGPFFHLFFFSFLDLLSPPPTHTPACLFLILQLKPPAAAGSEVMLVLCWLWNKLSLTRSLTHSVCPDGVRGVCLHAVLVQKGLRTPGETEASGLVAEVFSWRGLPATHCSFVLSECRLTAYCERRCC